MLSDSLPFALRREFPGPAASRLATFASLAVGRGTDAMAIAGLTHRPLQL
jgi:hypothetical protein